MFNKFIETYKKNLVISHSENPEEYSWSIDQLEAVSERMSNAVKRGSFNKDSSAFKATCKELGIKHTYKAIAEYIDPTHARVP